MSNSSIPAVESKWSRVLEYAVFGFPAMIGIAGLLVFFPFSSSSGGMSLFPRLIAVLTLVSLLGGLVLSVLIAVSLYFDAKLVRDADVAWNPSSALYGVAGFFFSGLVALHYLYQRYEYTASSAAWSNWWYGVAACLAVAVVAGVSGFLPVAGTVGLLGVVLVSAGVLPIVIYKDAVHVRGTDSDWLPNPVNYFLAVFFGSFLFVVPAIVGGYYLYKRHTHVDVP